MLQLKPLDPKTPICQQLNTDVSPVVLVNIFQVAEGDIPLQAFKQQKSLICILSGQSRWQAEPFASNETPQSLAVI